jgi:hypothetical protein
MKNLARFLDPETIIRVFKIGPFSIKLRGTPDTWDVGGITRLLLRQEGTVSVRCDVPCVNDRSQDIRIRHRLPTREVANLIDRVVAGEYETA